jgi:hypothetical protein
MGRTTGASRRLLSAAIGGLLCVGGSACSSEDEPTDEPGALADAGTEAGEDANAEVDGGEDAGSTGSDAAADASVVEDAGADVTEDVVVDAIVDAKPGCEPSDAPGVITLTETKELTLEQFTADCEALGGILEIHPTCGGANSCQGMSYDTDTKVYTEHTCKGLNTCAGFSCVICPPESD